MVEVTHKIPWMHLTPAPLTSLKHLGVRGGTIAEHCAKSGSSGSVPLHVTFMGAVAFRPLRATAPSNILVGRSF